MTRILSLLTVFAFAAATAFAQVDLGVKTGVNFATLAVDADEIDDASFRTGFTAGVYKQFDFTDQFTFQSELLYTQKGATYECVGRDVEAKLSYIDLPLSLQVQIPSTPLKLYVGAQASYLLSAKYEYESGFFENGTDAFEYDDLDGFKRVEFSGLAGVGLQIKGIYLDARLTRGFTNVEDDRTVLNLPLEANDTKNFGVAVTAGIAF